MSKLPLHPDARRLKRRELPSGEIGCFHSHWLLWSALFESSDDWLCILEDDVLLDHSFDFESFIALLERAQVHYVRLHFLAMKPYKILGRFGRRKIVRFKKPPMGTQAYLISRKAAGEFVTSIREIKRSIDEEMDRFWIHRIPIVAVFPFPVLEQDVPSTIFKDPFQKDSRSLSDIVFRQSFRMVERTQRGLANLRLRSFDRRCREIFPQQVRR